MPKPSKRSQIPPFYALEVLSEANRLEAEGRSIIHMEVGQPATGALSTAVEALKKAVDEHPLGYTESAGRPELRQRIARHYRDWYGVEVDPERILVTLGASGAFVLSFLSAFDAGDRVALAEPGYAAYRNILRSLDIEVVQLETGPETRFQPTVEMLEAVEGGVDGLIVASPANPTSTTLADDELQVLVEYCDGNDICLISDEIYHGVTYGRRAMTALKFSDQPIVVNSFSKYFSMTGWRLGWMVMPESLARTAETLAQSMFLSPSAASQVAGLAAFDGLDEADAHVARYARNREILMERLPRAGFDQFAPIDGAFYVWVDISRYSHDSIAFCRDMLREAGVAATPGVDFDPFNGHHYVRFSFAGATADMEEACDRLAAWMSRRYGVTG